MHRRHDDDGFDRDWDEECAWYYRPRKAAYRCSDGFCGALDCARCYPHGVDDGEEDEEQE